MKELEKCGTCAEPELGEEQKLRSGRQSSLPFSFTLITFLLQMIMFWVIGLDMQAVMAAPMHRAHKDDRLSSVLVHGLMKTLGPLGQKKSEAGRAPISKSTDL